MEQHHHEDLHHQHHMDIGQMTSEITIALSYQEPILNIHIEDKEGNAPELMLTHEKYMHLIVVSEDLQEFYHVHPDQIDPNTYQVNLSLSGSNSYKAFVDINPHDSHYVIEPKTIMIDSSMHHNHQRNSLKVDQETIKEIGGKTVEFNHDPFVVGEDVSLRFDLKGEKPEHYLGALGHIVIIDDKVENFIHVHPISDKGTVFIAHFEEAGLYKLWAEFKFDGKVIAFPYIIEVKRE